MCPIASHTMTAIADQRAHERLPTLRQQIQSWEQWEKFAACYASRQWSPHAVSSCPAVEDAEEFIL
jgi:hypothetical protein